MPKLVSRLASEQVTTLDLNLIQRFAEQANNRELKLLNTKESLFGIVDSAIGSSTQQAICLGGLQVKTGASTSTFTISGGALLCTRQGSAHTLTRPGTWSGNADPDDDNFAVYELCASSTNVTPGTVITTALGAFEWWLVYVATTSEATQESDSNRRVFNKTTGAWDAASTIKVVVNKLVPAVLRGSGGASLKAALDNLIGAGDSYPLAAVFVPNGATDHSNAIIYDMRRFPRSDPGPNMVGGTWGRPSGTANSNGAGTVWQGNVWARINNERVGFSASSELAINKIAEPGASWTAPSAGQYNYAWFYLAKINGCPVRGNQKGAASIGHTQPSIPTPVVDGAILVMSPTAPIIGVSAVNNFTGSKWDLRPQAPLASPPIGATGFVGDFSGLTIAVADAVCIGCLPFTAITGDNYPVFTGDVYVDQDGWASGQLIKEDTSGYSVLANAKWAFLACIAGSPGTTVAVQNGGTLKLIANGALSMKIPITALRTRTKISAQTSTPAPVVPTVLSSRDYNFDAITPFYALDPSSPNQFLADVTKTIVLPYPGAQIGSVFGYDATLGFQVGNGADSFTLVGIELLTTAVRFPYNTPLAT